MLIFSVTYCALLFVRTVLVLFYRQLIQEPIWSNNFILILNFIILRRTDCINLFVFHNILLFTLQPKCGRSFIMMYDVYYKYVRDHADFLRLNGWRICQDLSMKYLKNGLRIIAMRQKNYEVLSADILLWSILWTRLFLIYIIYNYS